MFTNAREILSSVNLLDSEIFDSLSKFVIGIYLTFRLKCSEEKENLLTGQLQALPPPVLQQVQHSSKDIEIPCFKLRPS